MKKELMPVRDAIFAILADPRSNRVERIECAKVLLSLYGQFVPDVDERWLSVRQLTELRRFKHQAVEKVLKLKRKNRKAYLKRRLKELEAKQQNQQSQEITQ